MCIYLISYLDIYLYPYSKNKSILVLSLFYMYLYYKKKKIIHMYHYPFHIRSICTPKFLYIFKHLCQEAHENKCRLLGCAPERRRTLFSKERKRRGTQHKSELPTLFIRSKKDN